MKDYKVLAISHKIKNWSNAYGDFTTYNVQLTGEGEDAIQLNKKSDSPAPKEGDELYGEITETEFGKRFKSAKKPFGAPEKSDSPAPSHDTQDSIYRSVAANVAGNVYSATGEPSAPILKLADDILAWLKNEPQITPETVKKVFKGEPEEPEPQMPPDFLRENDEN